MITWLALSQSNDMIYTQQVLTDDEDFIVQYDINTDTHQLFHIQLIWI